ncbi:MAG: efflux RND transporter periplasmic adaptor subunit [Deltaproteobacteria bacterium]|nr:MAG: efflux RND transporter periplasmic adaptor subunit [Deltaproteobacteria bacterium]
MSKKTRLIISITLFGAAVTLALGLISVVTSEGPLATVVDLAVPISAEAAQQYTCGMHPMIITDEPGLCPICNMDLTPLKSAGSESSIPAGERKIKYWVAPMDPTFIRDEPGQSPMGMDLVPVYEDEAVTGSIISIDPVTSQNMGVRTTQVVKKDLNRTVRTVGLVAYEEPKQFSVNSKVDGWVERLYINETGQFVKKGSALLEIYSPELVSAQEEFLLARNNSQSLAQSPFPSIADGANRLLESSRRRLKLWDISERQIKRLEESGEVAKTLTLYAPYDGIVSMKMVREGQFIKRGMELLMLSDISKIWIYADIYEYEMAWVKLGQKAKIMLPYIGSDPIESEVSYIYPFVEPKTRTIKARFDIDNPDFTLKPDMYVNVRLESEPVKDALAVPIEAVMNSGEKKLVFAALGDGRFEPRQIKVGMQDEEGYVQIIQGVLEGERVVTSAQFLFESRLREAIQKMRQPKPEPEPEPEDHAGHDMADPSDASFQEEELEDLFK